MVKKIVEDKPLTPEEKKKRLKQKMAFINKKAGKEVIKIASEASSRERIPFSAKELNEASGGGVPIGAFSVLWGGKAAGKTSSCYDLIASAQREGILCMLYDYERCIAEDTEIFEFKSNTIKKVQDICANDIILSYNDNDFVLSKVLSNICNGEKNVFEINTSIKERSLNLSREHRVYTKNGWKKVKDLSTNDSLACPTEIVLPEKNTFNPEASRLIGYMIGDGHTPQTGSYSYATIDIDIVKDISKILKKFSCKITGEKDGIHYRIVKERNPKEKRRCIACNKTFECYKNENKQFCCIKCSTTYTNKNRKTKKLKKISKSEPRYTQLKKMFIDLGIHGLKREQKIIPKEIMYADNNAKRECLGGLYSADGYINKDRNLISFNNLSKTLITQTKMLLLNFGIDSRITSYTQEINDKEFYILTIFGYKNIVKFYKNIKLCKSKQLILQARIMHGRKQNTKDSIEYINKDTKKPIFWNKITSIDKKPKKKVYDIMVEGTENLVVNNILIHNSFDPVWAKTFGVDPELLLIGKFKDAEAGLDNIIDICKEDLVGLIVVDSIQGLCPRGEYETKKGKEKSIADDTMALIPRKLSKFFPKAAPFVDDSNCAVVLIGQTRKGLGSFVVLDELTGGNALLHWSALTMHCRRGKKANAPSIEVDNGKKDKNGKAKLDTVLTGYEMVVKVDKSKVGPDEGKETRLPFYFGSGFVKPEEEKDD